jgi:acetylornithine deacetylase
MLSTDEVLRVEPLDAKKHRHGATNHNLTFEQEHQTRPGGINRVTHLDNREQRALDAVDPDRAVALLTELLAVPSISGSDAEIDIQHLLAKRMDDLGLQVDLWPMDLPTLVSAPAYPGSETERSEAWGLVATSPGSPEDDAEPALILQGHVDVVPAGDPSRWRSEPFSPTVVGHRIHGRGACDMKAGVAANLAAAAALTAAGIRTRRPFALHSVIAEEDGGLGAFGTLARGHTGSACIITEPTHGTLITANAGALTFTLEVPGRATHASTAYAGSSAITSYLPIHAGLAALQDRRNRGVEPLMAEYPVAYPISVGRLRAGDWASSVPDLLVAEGRMGLRIEEDPAAARLELEEAVAKASAADPFLSQSPVRVTWSGGQFAGGHLQPGHQLRRLVRDAHADIVSGAPLRERGAPYGSDLRLYAAGGIPTLHYGPGEVHLAHGPEESVDVREFLDVTRALVLTLLRACGTR